MALRSLLNPDFWIDYPKHRGIPASREWIRKKRQFYPIDPIIIPHAHRNIPLL
jgi:hypothetical protein